MECDGCTLCCKLLHIPWMNSPAGEYCKECEENVGCKIYNSAPKECLKYRCAYHQMEKVGIELRPDKCGVIFEKITEDIFIALSVNSLHLKNIVRRQIDVLIKDGFSVALSKLNKIPIILTAAGKSKEEVYNAVKEKHYDSTKLYGRFN